MTAVRYVIAMTALMAMGVATTATSQTNPAAAADASAHQALQAYVAAINSNTLQTLLGMLTQDVVFMAPNDKPYVGKRAVRPWIAHYLKAYHTHWDKPVQKFVVSGAWAFERYSYTSTDTPVAGGAPMVDTGWGLAVYHHDADGKWRVARHAWGSDRPAAGK
jgi:ketosteroid isomerase-like protein